MTGPRRIRVLLADDSFFARKLLREILSSDDDIEIAGEANDGEMAVVEAIRLKPDVITMDFKMPKMDGAAATEAILAAVRPPPGIVMVSAYTREGAEESLRSLRAGAIDFVLKPSGEISFDLTAVKDEILTKVKAAAKAKVRRSALLDIEPAKKVKPGPRGSARAIVLGASTGGPPVIENILSAITPDIKAAIFVAQHMPPYFTRTFAERLNKSCALPVKEAEDGEVVRRGMVYVAPGDFHMEIKKRKRGPRFEQTISLTDGSALQGLRPAIDVTMASVSAIFKRAAIGVVLSGMGADGKVGAEAIKKAGGRVIVQDPATAVIDAMPLAVIRAGLADEVLVPEAIAPRLAKLCV